MAQTDSILEAIRQRLVDAERDDGITALYVEAIQRLVDVVHDDAAQVPQPAELDFPLEPAETDEDEPLALA